MALNGADSVAINIEGLVSSIEKDMAYNNPFMSPNCCIFKTPTVLYRLNDKAYVPDAFSIGPFHHRDPNLTDTEKIKIKYLQGLISRSSPRTTLRHLLNSVKEVEREARECYSKPIGYSPDEFVKILVIDGCFVIELFRKVFYVRLREDNDPIFTMQCMLEFLQHDLILLENQVPWMVLERLYKKTIHSVENESEHHVDLITLAINFFKTCFSSCTPLPTLPHQTIEDLKHIPDLIIKWMVSLIDQVEQGPNHDSSRGVEGSGGEEGSGDQVEQGPNHDSSRGEEGSGGVEGSGDQVEQGPNHDSSRGEEGSRHKPCATSLVEAAIKFIRGESKMTTSRGEEEWIQMPSATSLVEAGIKFRRVESKSILDIEFKDGVLKIPPLLIYETTETIFRNLISFEQCYPNCEARFTSYAILIDNLINTAKDVDILCENKIIDNWLNPQDAVPFFNKLYHNTGVNEYYYGNLSMEVNTYCKRGWPRWRAALVRNYLHTPWAIFSAMAAIILLILSLLQTVYTMEK